MPAAALPGGEVRITGAAACVPRTCVGPGVHFGEIEGAVVISSDEFLVARVPPGAASGPIVVSLTGTPAIPTRLKSPFPLPRICIR